MGASFCKPRKRITTSSWIGNENENPFEVSFSKKERVCLRETYQRLIDPKELIGEIFVNIVNDSFDRVPKASMVKMPKFGGHISRINDFFEQVEPTSESVLAADADKKKVVRFAQNYTQAFISDVWRRFFNILTAQLTEAFEFERQKCLNVDNQKTLAPHQKTEQAEKKRKQHAEHQSEIENSAVITEPKKEELFEDPF